MTDTSALVAFLRARLDEAQQAAQDALDSRHNGRPDWLVAIDVRDTINMVVVSDRPAEELNRASDGDLITGPYEYVVACGQQDFGGDELARHIAMWDPARVLRQVAAGRAIIAAHLLWSDNPSGEMRDYGMEEGLEAAIRHLATVYAAHPDYRPEFAP